MNKSFYLKLNFLSIACIFMLFVLGGLVRATGSGMGCPDWPKCFGEYIPPTSLDQLPTDYKEIFLEERLKKAERFAAVLHKFGFDNKANEILAYEKLNEAHEFNVAKAYTEYINRLMGALTGIVVLLCFIASFSFARSNTTAFIYTALGFFAVILNALLGAIVVNANLLGGIVTTHFLAAFAAISFFMVARFSVKKLELKQIVQQKLKAIALSLMILMVLQIYFGTQVRETYDLMESKGESLNSNTIQQLGLSFTFHRTLALITLIISFLQFSFIKKSINADNKMQKLSLYILILIVLQIIFGSLIIMTDLSAISKLFHISIGAALFIIQFYICSLLMRAKTINN